MSCVATIKQGIFTDEKKYLYAVERKCEDCGEWLYHSEEYEMEDGKIAHAISFFLTLEDALHVVEDAKIGHYRILKIAVDMDSFTEEEMIYCKKYHTERGSEVVDGSNSTFA